ncbi:putative S-adenosylmethionine-dependent methyltransferase of the seven beta-strand family [Biscogniauxia marginata]|nr:putative S-adenosylmethionine-dependent methyltransferase of the seven beta-strand family [Biscogniauxia marginata]
MSTTKKKPAHLKPSKLGTKEYWDELYATEISNHAHDPSDMGTVWFDDSDAEAKMIEFLSSSSLLHSSSSPDADADADVKSTTSFLDLGTGNGSLLFGLRDEGFGGGSGGRMLGVDYSARSVEFARRIERERRRAQRRGRRGGDAEEYGEGRGGGNDERGEGRKTTNGSEGEIPPETKEEEGEGEGEPEVEFLEHDILRAPPAALLTGAQRRGWDAVLDKGTFDAVSLSSEPDAGDRYRAGVLPLVRPGGLFLVTSCNWTEEELRGWFEEDDDDAEEAGDRGDEDKDGEGEEEGEGRWGFEVAGRVQYPSFSFGGVKGQTISTLCFRKVKKS